MSTKLAITIKNHLSSKNILNMFCLLLSFLIPAILAANFTLNNFYFDGLHEGGDILDSGWQTFLSAHATRWPLPNPPLLGGTFFSTHISLVFYLYTTIYYSLDYLGFKLPEAVFFSLTQGFWFGLLSLASYCLMLPAQKVAKNKHFLLSLLFALLIMVNGVSLQMVLHPHFETAIPALLLTFFVLWSRDFKKLCYLPLIIALITKEDVGIHYFVVFIFLACLLPISKYHPTLKTHAKYFLLLSLFCIFYSIVIMLLQRICLHPETMSMVYLGSPPYHHVNGLFIKDRFYFNLQHRPYIYIPLIISCLFALRYRNILLFSGVLSVIPWMFFSFFAPGSSAGSLNYYYGFPMIIAYVWPAIVYCLTKYCDSEKNKFFFYWRQTTITTGMSTILFILFSGIVPDVPRKNYNYPIQSFGFQWVTHVKSNQRAIDFLFKNNLLGENFIFDHAIAGLAFDKITQKNYYPPRLEFSEDDKKRIDLVIFQFGNERTAEAKMVLKRLGLTVSCALGETDYFIAKKAGTHEELC